jgi:hypothetical protein
MGSHDHKDCYGSMFPDPAGRAVGREQGGKVFFVTQSTPSGMIRPPRRVELDMTQWDDCLACPEFDGCYKLCMARLALETALAASRA